MALLQEPRERFAHLTGHIIYIWFGGGKNAQRKPPRSRAAIHAIIDELANYRPDPTTFTSGLERPEAGLPQQIDIGAFDFHTEVKEATFFAVPMQGAYAGSLFFLRTGFEIGMAATTTISVPAIWARIWHHILDHDQSTIDHLIITIGGPDRSGFAFPAEAFLINAAVDNATSDIVTASLSGIEHLSRVTLHFWLSGRIVEIHPHGSILALYPGEYVPGHLSAAVNSASVDGNALMWAAFTTNAQSGKQESPGNDLEESRVSLGPPLPCIEPECLTLPL